MLITRQELAQYYLAQSSISPTEIAFLLGFQDGNSFIRAFKNWSGKTPGDYRQNQSLALSALRILNICMERRQRWRLQSFALLLAIGVSQVARADESWTLAKDADGIKGVYAQRSEFSAWPGAHPPKINGLLFSKMLQKEQKREQEIVVADHGISEILFGVYRRRVLALLLLRPDESFYVREISRLTGIPAGSLHRELKTLSHGGFLVRESLGNQVRYLANRDCPIYEELASIFRKTLCVAGRKGPGPGVDDQGDEIGGKSQYTQRSKAINKGGG